ncbi:hypothetical protein [Leptolyngbya sp. FACHB-8]|uniref:hypothetical protein n=1 Tax=unclassified Leptolyngbya TaxID=2650499 RepID=UPI0016831F88|nr:hypothetical protein [Leptolyngbya sp. FACHB-8]MBD1913450.1 hypothetical protein [Leptolyngbya sp. FACHB-8]
MRKFNEQKIEDPPVTQEHSSFPQARLDKKPNFQSTLRSRSGYEILEVLLAIALLLITAHLGYSYVATGPFSLPHFDSSKDAARL